MKVYTRRAERKKAAERRSAEEEAKQQAERRGQEANSSRLAEGGGDEDAEATPHPPVCEPPSAQGLVSTSILAEKRHVQRGRPHTRRSPKRSTDQPGKHQADDEEQGTLLSEKQAIALRGKNKQPNVARKQQEDEEHGTMFSEKQRFGLRGQHRMAVSNNEGAPDNEGTLNSDEGAGNTSFVAVKELLAGRKRDRLTNLISSPEAVENFAATTNHEDLQTGVPTTDGNVLQIEPGAIRVGLEREGTIRVLSDPPEESVNTNRSRNDLLVHAHVVVDDDDGNSEESKVLATATPDPWWRRHQWWLAGGAVVTIGAIIVAVVLTTAEFGAPSTNSPSMAPTTYPDRIETETIALIVSAIPDAASRLTDESSSQFEALQWIVQQRLVDVDVYSDHTVLQLYGLAVLFYGTGGESSWHQSAGWLSSTSMCNWHGVHCSSFRDGEKDGMVSGLNLTSNGLNGTVPPDSVAALEKNLQYLNLSDNDLWGAIPEGFDRMTALTHLSLRENGFISDIPSSFGSMTKLTYLDLAANSFGVTIPSELGFLTLLEQLRLDDNDLSGEIPSQLGFMTSM